MIPESQRKAIEARAKSAVEFVSAIVLMMVIMCGIAGGVHHFLMAVGVLKP